MSSLTSSSSKIVYRGTTPTLHAFNTYRNNFAVSGTNSRVCRHERVVPGVGRVLAPITCNAVVDRLTEFDLHSVDLGWPRGFPSQYDLGDQLGRGSFGTVYLATDRLTGEEVAAKVIPKERKGTTREHILEKIQQEVCIGQLSLTLTDLQTTTRSQLPSLRTFRLMCCGECKAEMKLSGSYLCTRYVLASVKVLQTVAIRTLE